MMHDRRDSGVLTPLRQCIKVSGPSCRSQDYLQDGDIGFLYQAHVSCIVVGDDEKSWKVFCFADTFFNDESSCDALAEYAAEDPEDYPMDLITLGRATCDLPLWNPRLYFFRVFSIRLQSIWEEWESLTLHFEGQVNRLASP